METILGADIEAIRKLIYAIGNNEGKWSFFISSLLKGVEVTDEAKAQFHTVWIELGGRIRNQVGDDRALSEMLSVLLPKYGGEKIRLYRGESSERYKAGRIGFCWTPRIDKAEMFGGGLNAYYGDGGMLLAFNADPASIISGPNEHSRYLNEHEHTVDPFSISDIEILKTYKRLYADR
ncbi:hypothetical protein BOH74_03525 [Pseudomonas versuta]|uniref:Uncharacterized protein n=1 Tax=Pseudomonas versuta TaxID=1788301 RepID=A0A853ZWL7_9PSED|nr:hypothetical protein [Pseudomonas versuta]OKA28554.1 hypothetical protein BOH74_03525 [Pseudomonas versuta]